MDKIHLFHDMGLDVFAIDYHGYGTSGGAPTESALTGDAMAAYFYLADKRNVKLERLLYLLAKTSARRWPSTWPRGWRQRD